MKPGDLRLVSFDEVLSLDERAPSDPAEYPTHDFATHDDEFRAQQQKVERLTPITTKSSPNCWPCSIGMTTKPIESVGSFALSQFFASAKGASAKGASARGRAHARPVIYSAAREPHQLRRLPLSLRLSGLAPDWRRHPPAEEKP
jgi:hypothetical protein